jgi:hypothetical protein
MSEAAISDQAKLAFESFCNADFKAVFRYSSFHLTNDQHADQHQKQTGW